jgi:Protein of unknown function (DUF3300)
MSINVAAAAHQIPILVRLKQESRDMWLLRTICWMCAFLVMLHVSIPAQSQSPDTNTQTPGSAPTQPPNTAPPPAPEQPALKPPELDALVALIALYPDPLLANVLMASTYPLEVVRAERWVNENKNLKEDAQRTAAVVRPEHRPSHPRLLQFPFDLIVP